MTKKFYLIHANSLELSKTNILIGFYYWYDINFKKSSWLVDLSDSQVKHLAPWYKEFTNFQEWEIHDLYPEIHKELLQTHEFIPSTKKYKDGIIRGMNIFDLSDNDIQRYQINWLHTFMKGNKK